MQGAPPALNRLFVWAFIYLFTHMKPSVNPFYPPHTSQLQITNSQLWVAPNPWLSFSCLVQFCDLIAFSDICGLGIFLFFSLLTTPVALGRVSCHDSLLLRLLLPRCLTMRGTEDQSRQGEKKLNYSPDCLSL